MPDVIQDIQIDLIDDPAVAMRTQFNDEGLDDLAQSIKTNGLIQPIIVKQNNSRFEVVAGHRRLKAHRLLNATHIQAIIKDYTEAEAESAKVHENLFREDVNPVDQAVFMARYVERTKCTLDDLAKMLNRTPEWVSGRLEILKYPDYLVDEVYTGKIPLGVAKFLNEIPDPKVKQEYTRFAALQGINIKTAKRWAQLATSGTLAPTPTETVEMLNEQNEPVSVQMLRCIICDQLDQIGNVVTDFVHPICRTELQDEFLRQRAVEEREELARREQEHNHPVLKNLQPAETQQQQA